MKILNTRMFDQYRFWVEFKSKWFWYKRSESHTLKDTVLRSISFPQLAPKNQHQQLLSLEYDFQTFQTFCPHLIVRNKFIINQNTHTHTHIFKNIHMYECVYICLCTAQINIYIWIYRNIYVYIYNVYVYTHIQNT